MYSWAQSSSAQSTPPPAAPRRVLWDKQANFLKSQARAQGELRSLIKQYDEMLHKNWELATEEQKARIDVMRAKANLNEEEETADDGFLDALAESAAGDWSDKEN